MRKLIDKIREKKGFTLAELLIVVAIIAVLVAIAIPVFTTQLEKSREATDAANLRSAYAEVIASSLTDQTGITRNVMQRQLNVGWDNTTISLPQGVSVPNPVSQTTTGNNGWAVTSDANGVVTVTAITTAPAGGFNY